MQNYAGNHEDLLTSILNTHDEILIVCKSFHILWNRLLNLIKFSFQRNAVTNTLFSFSNRKHFAFTSFYARSASSCPSIHPRTWLKGTDRARSYQQQRRQGGHFSLSFLSVSLRLAISNPGVLRTPRPLNSFIRTIFLLLHSLLFVLPLVYFLLFCLDTTSFEHLVFWSKMSFISFLRLSWHLIILHHLSLYSHTYFLSYSHILYSNTASFQRVMFESFIHVFHCIISKAREQN